MWNNSSLNLPGFELEVCNEDSPQSSHEIGYFKISESRVAFWIMRMNSHEGRALVREKLQTGLPENPVSALMSSLNKELCRQYPDASHCLEISVMVLDLEDNTLTSIRAGDFGPLVKTVGNQVSTVEDNDNNLPLGLFFPVDYVPRTMQLPLGNSFLWISPYTSQIQNSSGELYGMLRIRDRIERAATDAVSIIESIKCGIRDFIGEGEQSEDICLLALRRVE